MRTDQPGHLARAEGLAIPSLWAIRHPRATLAGFTVVLALAAVGLGNLTLDTDGRAMVPDGSEALAVDQDLRDRFGLADPVVVHLEALPRQPHEAVAHASGGLDDPQFLASVVEVTGALASLPGLDWRDLSSLATEGRDRVDAYRVSAYLRPLPSDPQEVADLRRDIEAARWVEGLLTGDDGSAAIWVRVPGGVDRAGWIEDLEAALEPLRSSTLGIRWVGAPVAEAQLANHLISDLVILLPASILLLCVILALAFRSVWVVIIGCGEALGAILFAFGVLGWWGGAITLPSIVLPVVLVAFGIADEIHLLSRYAHLGGAPALQQTVREMARPILVTSITTAAGFLSFVGSPIGPIRSFGRMAALGIVFCAAWSLLASPAVLALIGTRWTPRPPRARDIWLRLAPRLGSRRVRAAACGTWLLLVAGWTQVEVRDGWLENFSPTSDLRRAAAQVDAAFFGSDLLLVEVSFPASPDATLGPDSTDPLVAPPFDRPDALVSVGALEECIDRTGLAGGVLGPYRHLEAIQFLTRGRPAVRPPFPTTSEEIRRLWKRFDQGRGADRRRELVDESRHRTIVTVFLEQAESRRVGQLMASVRDCAGATIERGGGRLRFGGSAAISQAMIGGVVSSQLRSLALALVVLLGLLAWVFRSGWVAAVALAPSALSALAAFGVMGWLGIPLGVSTSLFAAICVGVGIDFQIHLLCALERADDPSAASRSVVPAILVDCVTIGTAFGLLAISNVPANARLGFLVALTLGSAAALTLLLLPLTARVARHRGDARTDPEPNR